MTTRSFNNDFRCTHCGYYITTMRLVCGVNHHNHCPYCLWSRHLDLFVAGDRLSACKAPMRPVGLTMKPARNKYAPGDGELMLVHICKDCGQVSINRIAADDDAQSLMEVLTYSMLLPAGILERLLENGISLLDRENEDVIQRQLMGEMLFV
jgi:hypothetical protein